MNFKKGLLRYLVFKRDYLNDTQPEPALGAVQWNVILVLGSKLVWVIISRQPLVNLSSLSFGLIF